MKIRFKVFIILLTSLFVFTTAYAYGTASGNVVDSKDKVPWVHGGEVIIYDNLLGVVCGTGYLDSTGNFSILLNGSQVFPVLAGLAGDCTIAPHITNSITVEIDFTCSYSGRAACRAAAPPGSDPNTDPSNLILTFTQNFFPTGTINFANLETGTGPTAIVLSNLTATSAGANPWLAATIVVGALALVSGGMVALRKQRR